MRKSTLTKRQVTIRIITCWAVLLLNLYGVSHSLRTGDPWGWASFVCVILLVLLLVFWTQERRRIVADEKREQELDTESVVEGSFGLVRDGDLFMYENGVIPITHPEDATDPHLYAMMKAFETGEPVRIYKDDDGVWRDGETDLPLPVQGDPKGLF